MGLSRALTETAAVTARAARQVGRPRSLDRKNEKGRVRKQRAVEEMRQWLHFSFLDNRQNRRCQHHGGGIARHEDRDERTDSVNESE
jgi:hypothetical protein